MDDAPPAPSDAVALPRGWRVVAAAAFAASRLNLPLMLAVLVFTTAPVTPIMVIRTFVLFTLLPGCGAWLVRRACAARVRVAGGTLTVTRPGFDVAVPTTSIARLAPWWLPLPCPGVDVVLGSGRRLSPELGAEDPAPLLRALADAGVAAAGAALAHPMVVWATARAAWGRWRWPHLVVRFPLFALLPTAVLFNAHQHIAYGGLLGQYYLLGLRAYVVTFAIYWSTVTVYQVLYASVLRGLAELGCVLAAAVAPSRATRVRRAAEHVVRVLYYAGVPVMLALRFAPW